MHSEECNKVWGHEINGVVTIRPVDHARQYRFR